jgi:hypothetical protein
MRLVSVLAAPVFVLSLAVGTPAPARADSPLLLNEILPGPASDWDGSGAFSSRDDEWIELFNAGPTDLALDGYLITDADRLPRYALSGSLAAGARLLVTGRMAYDWERAVGQPAFGLSLGNSGDAALLWRVAGAETLLVDEYAYRSHEAAADRATGRSPDGRGWVLFDGLNPYTGTTPPLGSNCMPSPGAANVCSVTPAERTSWGRVKTLYRR